MEHVPKKPKLLYHGSNLKNIEEFEPRVSKGQGEQYGAQVYASHDLPTALIFMTKPHAWLSTGHFRDVGGSDFLYAVIATRKEEFVKTDNGGAVYVLPSDSFEMDPKRGLGQFEWASPVAVRPIEKKVYNSALDALIENSVQVYFVDEGLFDKIDNSPDHGFEILKTLQSENQKLGKNVKTL